MSEFGWLSSVVGQKRVESTSEILEDASLFLFIFLWMWSLSLHVCLHHVWAWCPQRSEEGVEPSGTGVLGRCEPPYGCWELTLGPLEEQPGISKPDPVPERSSVLFLANFWRTSVDQRSLLVSSVALQSNWQAQVPLCSMMNLGFSRLLWNFLFLDEWSVYIFNPPWVEFPISFLICWVLYILGRIHLVVFKIW